ncbi:DUF4913 domain-containing protein [Streptomyces rubellomurinus]|uniref:DUF4913 domain-containing protein n=1 Tax=Streptomyces rubellomurinus (strain ATCC 31215) TaxID=359131 RepID=UPI0006980E2B|nr:DUF4913 domain-containing protein [Streptomyces rubellomurinus]
MAEDIDDLKAEVASLRASVEALSSAPAEPAALFTGDAWTEQRSETEDRRYPPFIFLLDGDELDSELRLLAEWVEGVLVPGCLGEPSADARWCHLWTEHWDAVGALHALWLAWQELTDPATCGYTGPSTWYRDHYRPCMTELRGPRGPFASCTKGEHRVEHRLPSRVPSAWYSGDDSGS